jgi:Phosphopantetheine attachment site
MPELSQAPVSDNTTKQLTQIWQEILGLDSITPDQKCFDLGGGSSLAV